MRHLTPTNLLRVARLITRIVVGTCVTTVTKNVIVNNTPRTTRAEKVEAWVAGAVISSIVSASAIAWTDSAFKSLDKLEEDVEDDPIETSPITEQE